MTGRIAGGFGEVVPGGRIGFGTRRREGMIRAKKQEVHKENITRLFAVEMEWSAARARTYWTGRHRLTTVSLDTRARRTGCGAYETQ